MTKKIMFIFTPFSPYLQRSPPKNPQSSKVKDETSRNKETTNFQKLYIKKKFKKTSC
jgi:hypothetical protein